MTTKGVPASASGAPGYTVYTGYDVAGLQTYARFGSASGLGITNEYDNLGRLKWTDNSTGGTSRTLSYLYDSAGRRSRVTHPDGTYFTYHYDAGNRLTSIKESGSADIKNFLYDALGRLTLDGNSGFATSYGYDGIWRPNSLDHNLAGTDYDLTLGFTFNAASQIKSETRSNDAYAWTRAYNISRSYAVNGLNQYTAAGPATFLYDANANLTSDGATSFVYDAENRLVSASGAKAASLTYDPFGRLLQTSGGSVGSTQFLYDGDELVAEYDGSANLLRRYVHGISVDDPVAWYEGSALTSRRMLFANHQGSIVGVTDGTGNSLARNSYDPWGIPGADNMGRFQFTGQVSLPELDMFYYKARIYSPTLGRFLQTDPVGYKDQVNLYAYVSNDPVNRTDPSGMVECEGNGEKCKVVHAAAREARQEAQTASTQVRALAAAIKSGDALSAEQEHLRSVFEKHFGEGSATVSGLNSVAGRLTRIADEIGEEGSGARIRWGKDKGTSLARARVGGDTITIRPRFFGTNNSRSSAIFHEGGHLAGLRDQVIPLHETEIGRVGRDGKRRAYGTGAAAWLARTSPERAQENTDNYNCYATDGCGGPP